ncbi:tyrosine-type recombinase/integrase [Butyrivibrio sp. INlla16]|uniref:tyrosine-type recombinase/integrase n=1 Tax=Butyrivibrio sp. INlla16 TaxID=1520807 RepID=UPI000886ECB9|nr:tyrosine-type recombinase/integrase [Butyrivibrio sp. INlla16]SDB45649.1 Site-specific recombinase XerD [Butyrivibrio sp. INlla16]
MNINANKTDTKNNNKSTSDYLKSAADNNMLSLDDARKLYEYMRNEEILKKYTFPTKVSSDGYYHIYVRDTLKASGRRAVKAKTIDELKEKVLNNERGIAGSLRKTFRNAFDIFQEQQLMYVKDAQKRVSVMNTNTRREYDYKRYFDGTDIAGSYIDDISKKDIEQLILMNLQRYEMRRKAFASMIGILNAVFRLAFQQSWIQDNVFARVDLKQPMFRNMILPDKAIEERAYSDEEITEILDYIHEKELKTPWLVTAYALEIQIVLGLRRAEVCALKWSDIQDSSQGFKIIKIQRELLEVKKGSGNEKAYGQLVDHTKTWRDRIVPISDELEEILTKLRTVTRQYYPGNEFLFPARDKRNTTGCIGYRTVYEFYRHMCRALSIPIQKDLIRGPHAFRRNACTDVVNASHGNVIMASKLFGNSPKTLLQNYYSGYDLSEARDLLNQRRLTK